MFIKNCWSYDLFAIPTGQTTKSFQPKKAVFRGQKNRLGFDFGLKTEVFLRLFDPSGCGISAFLSHQHLLPHKGQEWRDGWMEGWTAANFSLGRG